MTLFFLIVKVWQTVLYMLDVQIEGGQISTEDIEQFASGGYFFSWKFWRLFFYLIILDWKAKLVSFITREFVIFSMEFGVSKIH